MQITRPEAEKALLVVCKFLSNRNGWNIEESEPELRQLALSSGAEVISSLSCKSRKPNSSFLIGKGKIEQILDLLCEDNNISVVIFDHDLSSAQQRNIEDILNIKTIDRTQLILDIFAQHANSQEGKLQVELAQLNYLLPRLAGKGIYLSRLGAGIGTKGPGEQKLEVDRRRIRNKISKIKKDLDKVVRRKEALRKKRRENAIPVIGLVGYTNAGKTTLLNNLTGSSKLVKDSLFSTLDTVSRKFSLPNSSDVILFDTVGFIHNLPHHLVESFKTTLEEVVQADILLHVIDISNELSEKRADAVYEVLKQLEADDKPIISVLNKADLIDNEHELRRHIEKYPNPVTISAKESRGFDRLQENIIPIIDRSFVDLELKLPQSRMDLVNLIYNEGHVISKDYIDSYILIRAQVPKKIKGIVESRLKTKP